MTPSTSASPRTAPAPRRPAPASPCCGPTGSPGPPQWCGPRRCRPAPSRCPGRSWSTTHRTSSATCCTSGGPQVLSSLLQAWGEMGLPGSPSLTDIRSAVATYNFDSEIGRRDLFVCLAQQEPSSDSSPLPAPAGSSSPAPAAAGSSSPAPPPLLLLLLAPPPLLLLLLLLAPPPLLLLAPVCCQACPLWLQPS
ncbi:unconventional myosin-XVI-like [Gadus chalcogrammus]|uniref:unconventional myosin-XVI-like n=1 Tax=Gadus chalcogrammus TaxID=1042646 RepID=UPI0024C34234|nr:unconventional myosin-XVI-like [Gadus chalcogrammus]XP_056440974.1 unconventional myosin-XVI-like [Gadus chalcogrammus]